MPLLPLEPSCPLQTILLSDLVVWRTFFFKFEVRQTAIIVCSGLLHPTQQVQILKKSAENVHFNLQRAVVPDWMGSTAV